MRPPGTCTESEEERLRPRRRVGPRSFDVVQEKSPTLEHCHPLERIHAAMKNPKEGEDRKIRVSGSIKCATLPAEVGASIHGQ